VLATQIRQKDSVFYFCAYPADDVLDKVRFISRFYAEGEPSLPGDQVGDGDEVASFISKIEATDAAFQRPLSRAKVTMIKNFYETAASQPPIPGTVLLFTDETPTLATSPSRAVSTSSSTASTGSRRCTSTGASTPKTPPPSTSRA
jgi:hypothetical protein